MVKREGFTIPSIANYPYFQEGNCTNPGHSCSLQVQLPRGLHFTWNQGDLRRLDTSSAISGDHGSISLHSTPQCIFCKTRSRENISLGVHRLFSGRLLRLPLFGQLTNEQCSTISNAISQYLMAWLDGIWCLWLLLSLILSTGCFVRNEVNYRSY